MASVLMAICWKVHGDHQTVTCLPLSSLVCTWCHAELPRVLEQRDLFMVQPQHGYTSAEASWTKGTPQECGWTFPGLVHAIIEV